MYSNERFDRILEFLKDHKRANVAQLSEIMFVSEATVRRDLNEMQKLGLLRRTHGGAIYAENSGEVSIFIREEVNAQQKEAVATIALNHIPDFDMVFIDNSSTCLALAARLDLQYKTVVTTGFRVASVLLQKKDVRVIMPGGDLQERSDFAGSMTINSLRNFRFDLALCSCAAIDPLGSYENSLAVMELKSTALELSRQRLLLVDQTKFRTNAPFCTTQLDRYDAIITDAPQDVLAPCQRPGVTFFCR